MGSEVVQFMSDSSLLYQSSGIFSEKNSRSLGASWESLAAAMGCTNFEEKNPGLS